MNRSILIVICDFLLISLLAFSTVDINKVADEGTAQNALKIKLSPTNQPESGKELTAVMKMALDEERRNRDQLLGELTRNRTALTERERQAQSFQKELQVREQTTRQLQQEYALAQTNILNLNQQLQESLLSKEKLAAMEEEARKRAEQAAAMQQQITALNKSNQTMLNEKIQLASALQVAEVEKRHANEQIVHMTEEVQVERQEKAKLAEGVKSLATKSGELTQEIRENRPLAPNAIFSEFLTNRVSARLNASRAGAFGGESTRRKETQTILVSDGTNAYALCHVQDTPLTFANPGTDWENLSGTLTHEQSQIAVRSISFSWPDPRVALIPVSKEEAKKLGCRVYRISPDPFKFQDAVLVGAQEGYYGECKFEIDLTTPNYVKLDNNFLKGLFGKFNPSRGDLVFSRTGELLGVMANSTYCLMLRSFDATATVRFGDDIRAQRTGQTLAALYLQVSALPFRLQ
jgi:hypothetical protein